MLDVLVPAAAFAAGYIFLDVSRALKAALAEIKKAALAEIKRAAANIIEKL